jgi:tetratricopeptide (TPR) repeat protein
LPALVGTLPRVDWEEHAEREEGRYADGSARLPSEPDARQKQLVRVAMAATGAGLARLMQGRRAEAAGWLARSAERFRESFAEAPPGSWGRLIGAVKARVLAGDWEGAEADARWALDQAPATAESPIGRYAASLAQLVLGEDAEARELAEGLLAEPESTFPRPVAEALAGLAGADAAAYGEAVGRVLASFEERDAYLEDIPVADTVVVLEALAARRGLAAGLRSPLLPESPG